MLSLSQQKKYHQVRIKVLSLVTSQKRVSFSFPFTKVKASITVEASLVLPIFLMYIMTLLYSIEIVRFQSNVWEAVHKVSMEACFQKYGQEYGQGHLKTEIDVQKEIISYLNGRISPFMCVQGGKKGVVITKSEDVLGKGNIKITAIYKIKPFIKWLSFGELVVEESCLVHGFAGYEENNQQNQMEKTTYVFITPSGEKYHFDKDCTYLKVKVSCVKEEQIKELRNASGEIYHACEVCKPYKSNYVYYTNWGNRFHGNLGCTALKRTVYIVLLSEVTDRMPCSKCMNKKSE